MRPTVPTHATGVLERNGGSDAFIFERHSRSSGVHVRDRRRKVAQCREARQRRQHQVLRTPFCASTASGETTWKDLALPLAAPAWRRPNRDLGTVGSPKMSVAPFQFLLLVFAGWVNRSQVEIVADRAAGVAIAGEALSCSAPIAIAAA
jgi:hypothetical protein